MGENLPRVVSTGEVKIGAATLRVHHLDNGQRVIDADSFAAFMAVLEGETPFSDGEARALAEMLLAATQPEEP